MTQDVRAQGHAITDSPSHTAPTSAHYSDYSLVQGLSYSARWQPACHILAIVVGGVRRCHEVRADSRQCMANGDCMARPVLGSGVSG